MHIVILISFKVILHYNTCNTCIALVAHSGLFGNVDIQIWDAVNNAVLQSSYNAKLLTINGQDRATRMVKVTVSQQGEMEVRWRKDRLTRGGIYGEI